MSAVAERLRAGAPAATAAVRDQVGVTSGQVVAGIGNLAFSLAMARVLAPEAFGRLASFLALYLLLGMPASAISAAAAVRPAEAARLRPALLGAGLGAGVVLTATSPWVGPLLGLPASMVVVLGLSCPALGTLALERGRLYGWRLHGRLVASLVAEPATRLLAGVLLAGLGGATGGAFAVAAGGYAALELARRAAWRAAPARRHARGQSLPAARVGEPPAGRGGTGPARRRPAVAARPVAGWAAAVFLALVVLQNQDLLIANRLLSPAQAGQFAVVSVLGGISVFATMTVPLVLLPRAVAGERAALLPAVSLTALIGGAVVALVAVAPGSVAALGFGGGYRTVGPILVPYLAGMALLGVTRVVAAHACATGAGRSTLALSVLAVVLQAALILTFGHDPRSVALSTVTAVSGLTASLGAMAAGRAVDLRRRLAGLRALLAPVPMTVTGALAAGLCVRFIVPRGLWLDEATSVYQARMGFGAMLHNLRTTDVHPPLYFAVLWLFVHLGGSGALVVRLPSILAGTCVVPMLYLLGREAYDRRTGVVAAVAGSVAPILVWYSQEARMYAFMALFGVIAMAAQVRILRRGGGVLVWAAYSLASIALPWTQYFGGLQLLVQQAVFVGVIAARWHRREPVGRLALSWLASALLIVAWLVPLLPFAFHQYVVNQNAGKGFGAPQQTGSATSLSGHHLNVYSALTNLLWAVWGYHSNAAMALLTALWPLGMLFALALLGRRHRSVTSLLVAAVVVPGAVMFGLGLLKQNLFDIRYLSTTVPILFVLLARVVTGIPRRAGAVGVATCVLAASLLAGLVDQQYNGTNPRLYDFSGALASIEARARPGDVVLYEPGDLREVVMYYGPHLKVVPLGAHPAAPAGHRAEFVVASRSLMNGPHDNATLARALADLRRHGRQVAHRDFPNVQTWEFR